MAKAKIHRTFLALADQLELCARIKESYTTSRMNDADFALEVNTSSSAPWKGKHPVTANHVRSCREALNIPNNMRLAPVKPKAMSSDVQIAGLELRVEALESRLRSIYMVLNGQFPSLHSIFKD